MLVACSSHIRLKILALARRELAVFGALGAITFDEIFVSVLRMEAGRPDEGWLPRCQMRDDSAVPVEFPIAHGVGASGGEFLCRLDGPVRSSLSSAALKDHLAPSLRDRLDETGRAAEPTELAPPRRRASARRDRLR